MLLILLGLLVFIIVVVLAGIAATLSHHAQKPDKKADSNSDESDAG